MIEFVIFACAFVASGSETCREHTVPLDGATKLQCLTSVQINLAQWAANHDGWKIKKYHCATSTGKA